MIAIRGAITIKKDTPEEIRVASVKLVREMIEVNHLDINRLISILFTATTDIRSPYPGKFAREALELSDVAILHFQEMYVEESLERCIRVLMYYEDLIKPVPVYLDGATKLRPDLFP